MSAFEKVERPVAWCNLCRAVGDTYQIAADNDEWFKMMDLHTRLRHPEHVAALARGEEYIPVEVAP